jgi:surface antigen
LKKFIRLTSVASVLILASTLSSPAFAAVPQNDWVCHESGYICANTKFAGPTGYSGYDGPYGYDTDQQGAHIAHNCTSYVAYRFYQVMGYYHAPYNRFGDAADWDVNVKKYEPAASIGKVPYVDDIAQWNFGHVAWIEAVNYNANGSVASIVISDDNYGLKFASQRILYANQPKGVIAWPDNFIGLPIYSGGGGGKPPVATLQPLTTP